MPESFSQAAEQWLNAPEGLMHCWSPQADLLQEAVTWSMAQAAKRPSEALPLLFAEGDFFPLLQKLNELLAAAQRGESEAQAHAGQYWLVNHADRLSAEHLDILRRICLHYPELGIYLVLFSRADQAPPASEGVCVVGVGPELSAAPSEQNIDLSADDASGRRWLWGGIVAALVMGGAWWTSRVETRAAVATAVVQAPVSADAASSAASVPVPDVSASVPEAAASVAASTPVVQVQAKSVAVTGAAMSASRRWLLGLPAESLVVVHKQSPTLRDAETFRASASVLGNARILLTAAQDGHPARYWVVTGPFRSSDRAHNYMQRLDWKASASSVSREDLLRQIPN